MPSAMEYASSPLGAAIVGGGTGLMTSKLTSRFAAEAAEKANAFSERMSNTAMVRRADDLENAGFNRLLALGDPAAAPTGQMAKVPDFSSAVAGGVSSALQTKMTKPLLDKAKAEAEIAQNAVPASWLKSWPYRWGRRALEAGGSAVKEALMRGAKDNQKGKPYLDFEEGNRQFNRHGGNPPGLHHRPERYPPKGETAKDVQDFLRWIESFN